MYTRTFGCQCVCSLYYLSNLIIISNNYMITYDPMLPTTQCGMHSYYLHNRSSSRQPHYSFTVDRLAF